MKRVEKRENFDPSSPPPPPPSPPPLPLPPRSPSSSISSTSHLLRSFNFQNKVFRENRSSCRIYLLIIFQGFYLAGAPGILFSFLATLFDLRLYSALSKAPFSAHFSFFSLLLSSSSPLSTLPKFFVFPTDVLNLGKTTFQLILFKWTFKSSACL